MCSIEHVTYSDVFNLVKLEYNFILDSEHINNTYY